MILNLLNYILEDLFVLFNELMGFRTSSYPFVSGDSFRSIASQIVEFDIDNGFKIISIDNNTNKILFVETHLLTHLYNLLDEIKDDTVLILHNSDDYLKYDSSLLKSHKFKHIFAQNQNFYATEVTPIPIGLENRHLRKSGMIRNLVFAMNKSMKQMPMIYYQFNIKTNLSERQSALEYISKHPLSTSSKRFKNLKYFLKVKSYLFCLAPQGNGFDTHRIWECIYLNVIPICKENFHVNYFLSLNLPIWVVKDWSELDKFKTPTSLLNKYDEIMRRSSTEAAYWDYWYKKIISS